MTQDELNEVISYMEDQHQPVALVMAYVGLGLSDAVNKKAQNFSPGLKKDLLAPVAFNDEG